MNVVKKRFCQFACHVILLLLWIGLQTLLTFVFLHFCQAPGEHPQRLCGGTGKSQPNKHRQRAKVTEHPGAPHTCGPRNSQADASLWNWIWKKTQVQFIQQKSDESVLHKDMWNKTPPHSHCSLQYHWVPYHGWSLSQAEHQVCMYF